MIFLSKGLHFMRALLTICQRRMPLATVALAQLLLAGYISFSCLISSAGIESSMTGSVTDADQVAVARAKVQLLSPQGSLVSETQTSMTGEFSFFPISFGSYRVRVEMPGFETAEMNSTVTSSSPAKIDIQLNKARNGKENGKEIVVNVKETRNLVQPSSSGSKVEVDQERIATLPGGSETSLPKLISTTTPGVIEGPFGQLFIRGNHANIQYQIDGVQLPEATSGSFGEAFSPRNIAHMEVITGGIPAEYGERMSAVINIITKTGPETPGGAATLKYGSYNTLVPEVNYGGSDKSGRFRYLLSGSYLQTDRGLDTLDPRSESNQRQGGTTPIHDKATGNDEFARFDYILDDVDKFSLNVFNSGRNYQIPNYPSSFLSSDPFFQAGQPDSFGNQNQDATIPTFNWMPSNTNDTQNERNSYVEFVWKRTLSDRAFLQLAPYYKSSNITVGNDPANDLASATAGPNAITGAKPTSFAMTHTVDNYGLKGDYTWRYDERNLAKAGFQLQASDGRGSFSTQQSLAQPATPFNINDTGYIEAVYMQDSYSITKPLTLNLGVRASGMQFKSDDLNTADGLIQPRIGLEYMATSETKLHVFYGRLFQPAPFENLRAAFSTVGGGNSKPYDLKSEKDSYYETGITQQLGASHVAKLNYYYKDAINMLDDAQLLNTSIAQPYNFAKGYATGVEASIAGDFTPNWQYFANYSYENARGIGMSGGFFTGQQVATDYQFLDHCQLHTANAGLTYKVDSYWVTLVGRYGSGFRTGANNSISLPSHATLDATIGYVIHGEDYWSKWRVAFDANNIFDNAYPINVNNGFNGSHYAAGREIFLRLTKDL